MDSSRSDNTKKRALVKRGTDKRGNEATTSPPPLRTSSLAILKSPRVES